MSDPFNTMRNIEASERRLTPTALVAANAGNLKNFMAAVTPGGIEAQEKAGQLEQAALETLPIDLGGYRRDGTLARTDWERLGFQFGMEIDELFVQAKFPPGWSKRPTDHSMWSDVIDDKGRVRGLIFYKAAFYDRRANARLVPRFAVDSDYAKPLSTVRVKDAAGIVDFKVSGLEYPDFSKGKDPEKAEAAAKRIDAARFECETYLYTHFPLWRQPLPYWDC